MVETLDYLIEKEFIQFVGLKEEDSFDQQKVRNEVAQTYNKLYKKLNNEIRLVFHVKKQREQGKRVKYSVNCRLSCAGLNVAVSSTEWNLVTATQEVLKTLRREVLKKVKRH